VVPGLWTNLFAMLQACANGWSLSNKGAKLSLKKGKNSLMFDREIKTNRGVLSAVEIYPRLEEGANLAMFEEGKTVDVNYAHRVWNHVPEDSLKCTADHYGWRLSGNLEPCEDCAKSRARQKNVKKETEEEHHNPGELFYIDISHTLAKSYGGNEYWVLVVDAATSESWSCFVKHKDDQNDYLVKFFKKLKAKGVKPKAIRLDNSGENKKLQKMCEEEGLDIEFQFTPRDSPQFNGKVERKFQTLWSCTRSVMNAAKLDKSTRNGVWAEAARHSTDIDNLLVRASKKDKGPPHTAFYKKESKKVAHLRQFGEMAIVKFSNKIQAKLKDKGKPMMCLGHAPDHASDVYSF